MVSLFALAVLALSPSARDGEPPVPVVTPDGGSVPTVAPRATDNVAPVLAPELVADGGVAADGIATPIVAKPSLSVYQVDLPIEATVTAGSVALYAVIDLLIKPSLEGDVSCRRPIGNGRCNPSDLSAFDRYAVGRESREWQALGDVTLAASVIAPALYLAMESIVLPTQHPWRDFSDDALIVGQSMALTAAMQTVVKFAIRRPRPIRYTNLEEPLTSFDAELSFPSGHTSLVAAATTAMTMTIWLRHPKSPMRFVWLAGGVALTGLTGFSRVQSGNHFPTDVIVGALMGGFCGFIVPYVHRKKLPVTPTASLDPKTGASSLGMVGEF